MLHATADTNGCYSTSASAKWHTLISWPVMLTFVPLPTTVAGHTNSRDQTGQCVNSRYCVLWPPCFVHTTLSFWPIRCVMTQNDTFWKIFYIYSNIIISSHVYFWSHVTNFWFKGRQNRKSKCGRENGKLLSCNLYYINIVLLGN